MRQIHLTVLCLYKVDTVKQNRPLLTHTVPLYLAPGKELPPYLGRALQKSFEAGLLGITSFSTHKEAVCIPIADARGFTPRTDKSGLGGCLREQSL